MLRIVALKVIASAPRDLSEKAFRVSRFRWHRRSTAAGLGRLSRTSTGSIAALTFLHYVEYWIHAGSSATTSFSRFNEEADLSWSSSLAVSMWRQISEAGARRQSAQLATLNTRNGCHVTINLTALVPEANRGTWRRCHALGCVRPLHAVQAIRVRAKGISTGAQRA